MTPAQIVARQTADRMAHERMLRCVRACAGLSDESLEAGVVALLAKGARQILTAGTAEQYDAAIKLLRDADDLVQESE